MKAKETRLLLGGLNTVEEKFATKTLYWSGDEKLLKHLPRVSVIGSRAASQEGLAEATRIAHVIAEHGGVTVSGLAKGIDTAAHKGAIEAQSKTIAVIGTPLSEYYPSENKALQQTLMRDHLVISQFAEGSGYSKRNFPARNRTMALISNASVIVEAGEKSGTQHQGWEAFRLGRMLFISERVLNKPFDWPQQMLEYGAVSYSSPEHFRELLDVFLPAVTLRKHKPAARHEFRPQA